MNLRIQKIIYTFRHKIAFLKVEWKLCGYISMAGILHDTDKLLMLCIGMDFETVNRIHHKRGHHVTNNQTG